MAEDEAVSAYISDSLKTPEHVGHPENFVISWPEDIDHKKAKSMDHTE